MKRTLPIVLILTTLAFIILSMLVPTIAQGVLAKKKELALLRHEEKRMPELSQTLAKRNEEITLIKEAFPTKKDFALVAGTIDAVALQTGVAIDLHFGAEDIVKEKNGDAIVPVKVTIEGEFASVKSFLEKLAKGRYLYVFEKVEGSAADGMGGRNKVTVTAKLYAAID